MKKKYLFFILALTFLVSTNAFAKEQRMARIEERFQSLENGVVTSDNRKVTEIISSAATTSDVKSIVGGAEKRVKDKIKDLRKDLVGENGAIATLKGDALAAKTNTDNIKQDTGAIKNDVAAIKQDTTAIKTAASTEANNLSDQIVKNVWLIGSLLALGFIILGTMFLFSRRGTDKVNQAIVNLAEDKAAEKTSIEKIETEIKQIRQTVKPDSFILKFSANGEEYEYKVPVDERGKFISLYAVKVDPEDEPKTPVNTIRIALTDKNQLLKKSCKSAMIEYRKPECNPIQKALVDYLLDTKELRKVA